MKTEKPRPFNRRAFVMLVVAVSGVGLPLSGLANHLLQADPIGFHRHAWMAAHWGLGIIFTVFAAWHAVQNRRMLIRYLRQSAGRLPVIRRELALALALVCIPILLLMAHAFIAH